MTQFQAIFQAPPKDPDATLDYGLLWPQITELGDTITASTWTVTPDGELTTENDSFTAASTTVWLTGGTVGTVYSVTNRIETDAGRIDERTIYVPVLDR